MSRRQWTICCTINDNVVLLAIYVDDLFITCASKRLLDIVKEKLSKKFSMTDMGEMEHYLGIDIDYHRDKREVKLSQRHAVEGVLKRF